MTARTHISRTLLWLAALAWTAACQDPGRIARQLPAIDELPGAHIGVLPEDKPREANVIPTAEPIEQLEVTVRGERSLATLSTALGATVDDLMVDNELEDGRIQDGTTLIVRTTRSRLQRYEERRERRALARAAGLKARKDKAKKGRKRRTKREPRP